MVVDSFRYNRPRGVVTLEDVGRRCRAVGAELWHVALRGHFHGGPIQEIPI